MIGGPYEPSLGAFSQSAMRGVDSTGICAIGRSIHCAHQPSPGTFGVVIERPTSGYHFSGLTTEKER